MSEDKRKIVIPFTLEQFKDAIERVKAEYDAGNLALVGLFEIETLEYYYERAKKYEKEGVKNMNKYQKALKTFGNVPFKIGHFRVFEKSDEDVKKDYKLLQELVDKETTMKPNNFDKECCMYNCSNCSKVNATFKFDYYCPHCGQKLDWSKE